MSTVAGSTTINIGVDQLITLPQASRLLPRKPAPSTFWRWRKKGVKVGGRRIKLECVRNGGEWCTTAEAFAKFLRDLTAAGLEPTESGPADRTAETEQRLARAGLI